MEPGKTATGQRSLTLRWIDSLELNPFVVAIFVTEHKEFVHPVLAEPNIKHRELQWRKTDYLSWVAPLGRIGN